MFQGRFIGYTTEYVEFFIPQDGDYLEIPLHVQPDGSFCDTVQFSRDQYDLALFADKFMFRIALEQGKTYTAEFYLREEGVETNFSFTGEGDAENTFMAHLWALNIEEEVDKASSFKEFRSIMANCYRPLREELSAIPNKPFVKFYKAELRVIHHVLQRGQVTRVCEAVHTDDPVLRMFLQHIKDKIGSDKTGAAGHNDIHQVFPPCI